MSHKVRARIAAHQYKKRPTKNAVGSSAQMPKNASKYLKSWPFSQQGHIEYERDTIENESDRRESQTGADIGPSEYDTAIRGPVTITKDLWFKATTDEPSLETILEMAT